MDRNEWLELRKNYVTASDVPVVLGLSVYLTPLELWMRKKGFSDDDETLSGAAEIGMDLEPVLIRKAGDIARCKTEWLTGDFARSFKTKPEDHLAATIDGVITLPPDTDTLMFVSALVDQEDLCAGDYILEAKTTSHWDGTGPVPEAWYAQVQTQMYVHGYSGAFIIALVLSPPRRYVMRYVDFSRQYIDKTVLPAVAQFWSYMESNDPPPVTSPDDLPAVKTLYADVDPEHVQVIDRDDEVERLVQLREEIKVLSREAEQLEAVIREKAREAARLETPSYVVRFSMQSRKAYTVEARTIKMMKIEKKEKGASNE